MNMSSSSSKFREDGFMGGMSNGFGVWINSRLAEKLFACYYGVGPRYNDPPQSTQFPPRDDTPTLFDYLDNPDGDGDGDRGKGGSEVGGRFVPSESSATFDVEQFAWGKGMTPKGVYGKAKKGED